VLHDVAAACGNLAPGGVVHPAPRFAPRSALRFAPGSAPRFAPRFACHGLCAPDVTLDQHQSVTQQAALAVSPRPTLAARYENLGHLQAALHCAFPTQPELEGRHWVTPVTRICTPRATHWPRMWLNGRWPSWSNYIISGQMQLEQLRCQRAEALQKLAAAQL
jgi:hypothetical protein